MLYFSRHAKRRMQWRQILEEEVKAVITSPDRLMETAKGRMNAWKQVNQKLLKVTYKMEHDTITIVTVIVVK